MRKFGFLMLEALKSAPHLNDTPQSRVHLEKRSMDHNDSSYEWNYQDSMWNQIGKNKYIIQRVTPFSEHLPT